jgi:O-antigen/teichoic acid export membrane protein
MNRRGILGFAVGPFATALFGIIALPTMAWIFSPEDIGRLNILQITISFSLLLLVLGLDQAYVREFHESANRPLLLKACFLPGFLLLCAGAFATAPFAESLSLWLFGEESLRFYALTLTAIVATYISRFLSLILRMQERGLAFSMSQVIPKALQLLLLGVVIVTGLSRSFLTLLLIAVASALAVVLIYAWNTRIQWRPALAAKIEGPQMRSLLQFGLPLAVSGVAYWGLKTTSTLVLRSQSSLGELGIYAVTSGFANAAAIFQSIFTIVWAPTVYKWVSQGVDMARVDSVARQALAVVCAVFVLAGCFSWLTDYLLPAHYLQVKYMVLCAIAPPLLYTLSEVTCVGIGISRRTTLTVWITFAALCVNVLLNLWLVPAHGAAGAVMSNAVAYVIFFIARTEASALVWRSFPRKKIYIAVVVILLLTILTVVFGPDLNFSFSFVWLFGLPLTYWIFQRELADVISSLKLTLSMRKQHQ